MASNSPSNSGLSILVFRLVKLDGAWCKIKYTETISSENACLCIHNIVQLYAKLKI